MKNLLVKGALVTALMVSAATAQAAVYSFNFDGAVSGTSANDSSINPYSNVTFLSAFTAADKDADGFDILDMNGDFVPGFTHIEAYSDSDIKVVDPSTIARGNAISGANSLDGRFDSIYLKFSDAQSNLNLSFQLENTHFGLISQIDFVDASGKVINSVSQDIMGHSFGQLITASSANAGIYGIVISSGSTFDNLSISTIAAVPESDTYAMLLAGLGIMGLVARRRG